VSVTPDKEGFDALLAGVGVGGLAGALLGVVVGAREVRGTARGVVLGMLGGTLVGLFLGVLVGAAARASHDAKIAAGYAHARILIGVPSGWLLGSVVGLCVAIGRRRWSDPPSPQVRKG
jgi:hypothetical protein